MSAERTQLVAPCGIDCGSCELLLCKDNPELFSFLVSIGIPKGKLPCGGCRLVEGNCPVIGDQCATYACGKEKNIDFCHECKGFPCDKFHPAADRADVLPHNLKIFNLGTIKRDGVESFVKQSMDIKQKYYKGKMEVGKGPKI